MQAIAARQLVSEGVQVSAGQNVSYILQEANGLSGNAVLTSELIDEPVQYDVQKYKQLLIDSTAALLSPLGYDKQRLNELFKMKAS